MGRQNIIFDGSVFVMAQMTSEARTGIFFLLRDLGLALARSPDAFVYTASQPEYRPQLEQALAGTALHATIDPARGRSIGSEPWALLSVFQPAPPQLHAVPQLSVFQMVYDLSYHACPQLQSEGRRAFEKSVVNSIAVSGHAVCISENTRNDVLKYFGFPRQRASVVYPAVRSDLIGPSAEQASGRAPAWTGLPPHADYILALSTLEPRKNLVTSLRAFVTACAAAPEKTLYFVVAGLDGWGDQRRLFDDLPDKLKDRVRLLGYVNDPELPALLEGALCLLYPSVYEGFGLPPLEAMTRGVPVVVSNAGSLPEVVSDAGIVADVYDYGAMGAAIARLASDPAERMAWAAKGREQAKRFSWEASGAKLIEIMQANARR